MIFTAIKAALCAVFSSLWSRFSPPKTAADEKVEVLQAEVNSMKAEDKALAVAPMDRDSLLKALRDHSAALLFVAAITLAACAHQTAVSCPVLTLWTPIQQDELAANLAVLPPDSPVNQMGVEWARLRAWGRGCNGGG